jgi:adenylate kinase family enzyme
MKYEKEFPLFKSKVDGVDQKFDLSNTEERAKYFEAKAGDDVAKLKKYFAEDKTFIAYLVAKKSAGKGTYTKLMKELFGDVIGHISAGDVVRHTYKVFTEDLPEKAEIMEYLEDRYRGYMSLEDAVDALIGKTQEKLLPTEFILTLIEREIDKMPRKTLFIDGLPRDLDQISYSLYFRNLINYRKDPDFFIAIDIPESIIDERMKYRVICPTCQAPRNTKLFATQDVEYSKEDDKFYLLCDEHKERMVGKEGDDAGIESIRERTDRDQNLIDKLFSIHGLPLILLRNGIPVEKSNEYVDDYELTPAYSYEVDDSGDVKTIETPWSAIDDEGAEVNSLLAPPVVLSLIKRLVEELKL